MGDGPTNIFQINISSLTEICRAERLQSFLRFVKQQFGHQLSITLFVPQNISVHPHLYRRGTGTVLVQGVTVTKLCQFIDVFLFHVPLTLSLDVNNMSHSEVKCFTPNGYNWLRWGPVWLSLSVIHGCIFYQEKLSQNFPLTPKNSVT